MAATKSKAISKKASKQVKASATQSAAATAAAPKAAAKKKRSKTAAKQEPARAAKVKRVDVEPTAKKTGDKGVKAAKSTEAARSAALGPVANKGSVLTVGDTVPAFEALDQNGARVTSASLAGAPYVIYFYPKDDTPGCTTEACGFRDEMAVFAERGVRVLGVSPDSTASHARFAQKYGLEFTLLADTEKKLVTLFGVWKLKQNYGREYWGVERSTFVVDGAGKVAKQWRGVKVAGHVPAVLEAASQL